MSGDGSAQELLTNALLEAGASVVPGKAVMYELEGASVGDQARILSLVRSFDGEAHLLPGDDPSHDAPEYTWIHTDPGSWILPADAPSEALLTGILRPGAWRVYVAGRPAPVEDTPDLFRGPTIAALDFLERYGVSVVLDAWHDNTQWRIALLP